MQKTLVIGAAGALGRLVVTYLKEAGYRVHVMSRRSASGPLLPDATWIQADMKTGQGLAAAVQDMDVIVHAARFDFRSAILPMLRNSVAWVVCVNFGIA